MVRFSNFIIYSKLEQTLKNNKLKKLKKFQTYTLNNKLQNKISIYLSIIFKIIFSTEDEFKVDTYIFIKTNSN